MCKKQHVQHAFKLITATHHTYRHRKHILIFCQHIILDFQLIMIQSRRKQESKHQKQICKQDSHKKYKIIADILKDHAQAESVENLHTRTEINSISLLSGRKISSQKFKRGQFQFMMQDSIVNYKHNYYRNYCRQKKCFCIPYSYIGRQTVASIIHTGTYILKHRIT